VEKESLKDEKNGSFTVKLEGSNGGTILMSNKDVKTTGEGQSKPFEGTYTDNASNGSESFNNSYAVYAPAGFDVTFSGHDGVHTATFNASWSLTEAGQNIGTPSIEGGYYMYPYTNKVTGTYSLEGESVDLSADATKTLKVARSVPKVIPDEWGKITSAGISIVPGHMLNEDAGFVNGNFVDGGNIDQKPATCLEINTTNGGIPVIFGWADQQPYAPTTAQILGATFTKGTFGPEYNSGAYTPEGIWVPAKAYDDGGICYDANGVTCWQFYRNESLEMWKWRKGNLSTKASSEYSIDVTDGVLTLMYGGKIVLEIR
jgi:hypothetical protein